MDFKYDRTIPSTQIRLLRPLQISDTRLAFTLQTYSRASAPPYTALSYTWGTSLPNQTIALNNAPFPVRTNLWSALRYISESARHTTNNLLWVDAICINQTDIQERNDQVRVMDEIYKRAGCVAVWLGLAPLPEGTTLPSSVREEEVRTLTVDRGDLWVDSIQDLGNRQYWSRYWVIQEFLLAGNLQIHCSNTSMNWFDFQDLVQNAHLYQLNNTHQLSSLAALPLVQGRHPDKHPEMYQPFHALLSAHHRSQCSEPRDRIFALLGLIPEDDRAFLGRVLPDYRLDVEIVRVIALAHVMQYDALNSREPALRSLTPETQPDIFLGLGLEREDEGTRLARIARGLQYFSEFHVEEVMNLVEEDDWLTSRQGRITATSWTSWLRGAPEERRDPILEEMNAASRALLEEGGEARPAGGSEGMRLFRWAVVLGVGISGWYWLLKSRNS